MTVAVTTPWKTGFQRPEARGSVVILGRVKTSTTELGHHAHPDSGVHPGVVLIHDVWGLADHTRDLAGRLASEGYAVLAVDLYRRQQNVEIADPGEFMRGLSDPLAVADVQAGIDFLAEHPASAGRPAGVVGFCMGGMVALLAACECDGLSAAVPYYGLLSHTHGILYTEEGLDPALKPREPLAAAADLRCPLFGIFGGLDTFIPKQDLDALERTLAKTPHETEIAVYPAAGHAFLNDTRPDAYRKDDATHAWSRMLSFLSQSLQS